MMPVDKLNAMASALARGEWLPDCVMVDEYEGRRPTAGQPLDVVFIRNDWWTLGAPAALEQAARRTWAAQWICVLRRVEGTWRLEDLNGQLYLPSSATWGGYPLTWGDEG
jgi:hypothetical protein